MVYLRAAQIAAQPFEHLDFHKNPLLQNFRDSWKSQKPPNDCRICENQENHYGQSRRTGSNDYYKFIDKFNTEVELVRIDYWVGNTCNLACVICGPSASTTWQKELGVTETTKRITNFNWKAVPLDSVKQVHFNGGEPLLDKAHLDFLTAIPNKGEVRLNYNTNGSVIPSKKMIDIWKAFELVQLDFSIDDIENRFEYQRYPAKWNTLVNNLDWLYENAPVNVMFDVNTTVSVLNQYNLENLDTWLTKNFYQNRLGDSVAHRKQLAAGLFSIENVEIRVKQIINFLDDCDRRRNTNWRTVMPELNDHLQKIK